MSLRLRLTVLTGLTLAAGLAVLCLAGNVLLAHTISSDVNGRLSARLDAVASSVSVKAGHLQLDNTINDAALDLYAWVYDGNGRQIESPVDRRAPTRLANRLARDGRSGTLSGPDGVLLGSRPVMAGGRRIGTIVADISTTTYDSLRHRVLFGSIAVALLTLLVAVLAIRRALGAALAPVQQMTRDAADWGAHDLDRRFALGPGRDEITALAKTLDALLDRIAASRRHEQRFAAEVAHELRTPLAAVRGIAELAFDSDDLPEALRAIADIQDQAIRLGATLDTLIAAARRDTAPVAGGVDLASVARSFNDVLVTGGPVPRVEGDPALVRQILAPIVDNARRYAASSIHIAVSAQNGTVLATIRDDGPGVDPGLGDRVFLPGVRDTAGSGDGAGLGLPLARRLAQTCGGEIRLGHGPGGCFIVALPRDDDSA